VFTDEQRAAIERRSGDLLLDAGAGSGKTSVLVERFARSVLDDGVRVHSILTITFTDKAAAELRDRIRSRLRSLGAVDVARDTEGAFISTIHGFCARVLRANALAAGIDPAFVVLERASSERLMDAAFDDAVESVGGARELLAAWGVGPLRAALLAVHAELRSRGQTEPALPSLGAAAVGLPAARSALVAASAVAAAELGGVDSPGAKVLQALERLERVGAVVGGETPWPADLDALRLPGGNGAALSTVACEAYAGALAAVRAASEWEWSLAPVAALDELLQSFGSRYAALKRASSAVDFEDLELMTRDLLASEAALRAGYRDRFARIMVDELQDTNAVQLALIESIANGNLFTVGDAHQSIYGFRHADVALFERRGKSLEADGRRLTLRVNFRSRPEIVQAVNLAFGSELGERFQALEVGRVDVAPAAGPCVELLIADKGSDWEDEGIAAPWRVAEARALAARVGALVDAGAAAREIVLLTRATTDLRAYERALEERGIPTYVIGGRGYWAHPQIVDMVAYLRALANPQHEEALFTVLASPLVGLSLDALVIVAAAARALGRDPWWTVQEPVDGLAEADASRLASFASWFARERDAASRRGIEELVARALEASGYDLAMLAMPGGTRRLANVRKLMRLGGEHDALSGPDLRGFLELVRGRASGSGAGAGDARESEAPVEGEALDAVRLMTIHRAKGLEFEIVCVADLGRAPWRSAPLLRVGTDGRLGLRLARPGTGRREYALHYGALRDEQLAAEAQEERRLFYVAMTRAQERLIVSGAVNLERWPTGLTCEPMGWVGPALVPDVAAMASAGGGLVDRDGVSIALSFVRPGDVDEVGGAVRPSADPGPVPVAVAPPAPPPPVEPGPPVSGLSYSSLGEYARCGYRFYLERVLRLPRAEVAPAPAPAPVAAPAPAAAPAPVPAAAPAPVPAGLTGTERGIIAHALLERLDFRRPVVPDAAAIAAAAVREWPAPTAEEAAELAALIERFTTSELCSRLAAASGVRREERFAFALGGVLIGGFLDVLAWEPGERALVVDYKSDRLEGADPGEVVAGAYETQRLIYALAALRGGAAAVEVVHVFLELPDQPAVARFEAGDVAELEQRLERLAGGVLARDFRPAAEPQRALCGGCPGEGGLCSWPLSVTRREAPDRLF
jgi:ATP-dependent exoDNAse (exonuclease V) beta subunit